jgi:shikimate kinase
MDETMQQIHKLANERHMLYRQASHQSLTNTDRQRLQQLNSELPLLWDRYRREYAARRQPLAPDFTYRRAA